MFKSLDIVNFQSHEHTHLDFSDGVNLIVGKSDCGKSAILRAINWVVYNRPLGDGFIRDGFDDSAVILCSDEGVVERVKGSDNSYRLTCGGDTQEFKAFGSAVPLEITNFFNLSDVNIQGQLSPYFLVLESPGFIGKYLREVCKLDKLDLLYSDIEKKIKKCNSDISQFEEESDSITSNPICSIEFGEDLSNMGEYVLWYEEVSRKLLNLDKSIVDLKALISSISSAIAGIKVIPETLCVGLVEFELCCERLGSLSYSVSDLGGILESLNGIRIVNVPEEVFSLLESFFSNESNLQKCESDIMCLINSIKHLTNEDVRCLSNIQNIKDKETTVSSLCGKLTTCPVCEQSVESNRIDNIIRNLKI